MPAPKNTLADDKVVEEARKRFKRCSDYESTARQRFRDDMRFAEADSDNLWQWEDKAYKARIDVQKPALTVNKTREHNLQILNDQRQNKSQIKIRPVGDGATNKAADIFEGIVRHIEYQSRAMEAYDAAAYSQIYGGWGFWRLTTDYVDGKSFDQEIFIRRVRDPLSVYLDPDCDEFDKSDARFGFVFRDRAREEAEVEHSWLKDEGASRNVVDQDMGWNDKDHVRECEYYRKSDKADELLHMAVPDASGQTQEAMVLRSDLKKNQPDFDDDAHGHLIVRKRDVTRPVVEWFKILGDWVVERKEWPGAYIPLVMVIGEETVIDGQLDRKGHTRALKDPQRMYNWYTSEACAYAAGQTKTPWLTPAQAIEGYEQFWNNANTETVPYLPYNHMNDAGQPIPPPQKINPPITHSAAMEGMKIAQMELMMASGQYQSQFGENENAKSGIAIQTRQRQGDNATYHYIDHLAQAIEFTGRQLIDLIPKIYDTPRVIKIMAEDGDQTEVNIDPNGPAYQQMVKGQPANEEQVKQAQADPDLKDTIETVFNPTVGKFDVEADIGPAFATRRQESFAAMTDIAKQNPDFMKIGGDLYFKQADFPLADELAERYKRSIPKAILGEGPPPEMEQLQQQLQTERQATQQVIGKLTQELADKGQSEKDHAAQSALDDYKAETDRMKAVAAIDPEAFKPVIRQLISEALGTAIVPLMAAHAHAEDAMMPQEPAEMEPAE